MFRMSMPKPQTYDNPTAWLCKKCGMHFTVPANKIEERKQDGFGLYTYCNNCQKKEKDNAQKIQNHMER